MKARDATDCEKPEKIWQDPGLDFPETNFPVGATSARTVSSQERRALQELVEKFFAIFSHGENETRSRGGNPPSRER